MRVFLIYFRNGILGKNTPLKFLTCFLVFCLLSLSGFTQNLTLKQLLRLRQLPSSKINQQLTGKGWTFMADAPPDSVMKGKAVWAFNPVGEGATAWCVLYYSEATPARILYNSYTGKIPHNLYRKIRRRKMVLTGEGHQLPRVQNLSSYQDFADDTCVLRYMQYQQAGAFGIKIFEKNDFLKAKANNHL